MKRVAKFKTGEEIPESSRYLFSVLGEQQQSNVDLDRQGGAPSCPNLDDPKWVYWHFYEVPGDTGES